MNLFTEIKTTFAETLRSLAEDGALPADMDVSNITVEPPRDAAHGDMASNAAMVLSKQARMKPRDLAEILAEALRKDARITEVTVAGPGFLNLRLVPEVWQGVVAAAIQDGSSFGRGQRLNKKANVEFVSANPTGPLHVGHTRGAVFGDALAGLLDFAGWDVTREYYINDGGAQVDVVARSAYLRYREACGEEIEIADGLYPGNYLVPVGEAIKASYGDSLLDKPESEWLAELRDFATDAMLDIIKDDLAALGIHMDQFFSEKSLYRIEGNAGPIDAVLNALEDKELI